jgi:CHAT domain-containing protein
LVFATHAIQANDLPYVKEPALVLTQVNTRDGFLAASEVLGLKLNCDLAVLLSDSAGVGRILPGEGVISLGRSFQYAGARSVLMPLWNIAEESSVILAERFFTNLKEGRDPRTALRKARHDLRTQSGGKYDHPYFWAPFILMGE